LHFDYHADGTTCLETCGDGILFSQKSGHQCDDGNIIDGDGCSSQCKIERGWVCNTEGTKPTVCREVCGDGRRVKQECDDGNGENGDGCSSECKVEDGYACEGGGVNRRDLCYQKCGQWPGRNGTKYECDDENLNNGDGCSSVCKIELGWNCSKQNATCWTVCGDGIIRGNEECDDQN
jgi:large repetitive protein